MNDVFPPMTIPSTLPVAPVVVALCRKGIIIHSSFWAWDAPADNSCVLYSLILARDFDQVSRHSPEDLMDHLESEQLSLRCTDALPSLCQSHSTEQSWLRIWSGTLLKQTTCFRSLGLRNQAMQIKTPSCSNLQRTCWSCMRIKLFPTRDVQQRNALPERVILLLANLTRCNIAVSFFRNNALMATTADCRSSSTPKTTNTYLRSSRVGV